MANSNIDVKDIYERFRELFGLISPKIIGVDIGQSSVKIAEIEKKGDSFKLVKFLKKDLPEGSIVEDEVQKPDEIKQIISAAIKKGGFSTSQVCLGLYGPNTIARKLQLAGGSEEELEDQVFWEAEQYLPFPLEDSNLDHHLVGENIGGGVDVIVAAVKKDVMTKFKGLVENDGSVVKVADLSSIAISNLFIEHINQTQDEDDNRSRMLIDFGSQKTIFIMIKNRMPIFVKEVMMGGMVVTEEIQRQLGVNFSEAEDLKITTDGQGNLPEEIVSIINSINQTIIAEIRKAYDIYISATSDDDLAGCYVTGGSIRLPKFLDSLSKNLNVDITVFNPFESIEYASSFSEEDLSEIAYIGAVSLGLAMRSVEV